MRSTDATRRAQIWPSRKIVHMHDFRARSHRAIPVLGWRCRLCWAIAMLLIFPLIARANPVMNDGQSLNAFGLVAFWALVIESGIATMV
jgi:hypothetical protein